MCLCTSAREIDIERSTIANALVETVLVFALTTSTAPATCGATIITDVATAKMAFISFLFIIISPLDFLKKRIVELNLQSKKLVN